MVTVVLYHDVEGVPLYEQAGRVVADEDGGGLQVQECYGKSLGFDAEVEGVGSGYESNGAIRFPQ